MNVDRLARWILLVAGLLMALLAMTVLGIWAMARNEAGTLQLLGLVPGVKVVEPKGALFGDFTARQIEIALPRKGRIELRDVTWGGLRVVPDPGVTWLLGFRAERLSARRLDLLWVSGPPGKPATSPPDLRLPVSVVVDRVQVAEGRSRLWGSAPLVALEGAVALDVTREGRRMHSAKLAHLGWQGWALSGDGSVSLTGDKAVQAHVRAQGAPSGPGQGSAVADMQLWGPLADFRVEGQVAWQRQQAEPQSLRVQGDITAFQPWPLSRLQVHASGVNLSDVDPAWPRTALFGDVTLMPAGHSDLTASVQVRNEWAGPLEEQRLPVRQVQGRAQLTGVRAGKDLHAALNDGLLDFVARVPALAGRPDGLISLKGGWGGARRVQLSWQGLEPQALHHLAPPLQIEGSIDAAPKWRGGLAEVVQTPSDVSVQVKGLYGSAFVRPGLDQALRSRYPDVTAPVSLVAKSRYEPGAISVAVATLEAREARAELTDLGVQWAGHASASQPAWAVKGRAHVASFDPQVWLPWPAEMKGSNQLTGDVILALDADWRGQLQAKIAPSQLGGLPLQGQLQWRSPKDRQWMSLETDLDVGGNTVQAQAELPWLRDAGHIVRWGTQAHWQASVHAPALQNLQAIAPLLHAKQIGGAIEAQGKADGVWPALVAQGQLDVSKLQWVLSSGLALKLDTGKADWQVDMRSPDSPARVNLGFAQGQIGQVTLDQAQWRMEGSVRAHRSRLAVDVSHDAKAKPGAQDRHQSFHLDFATEGGWQSQPGTQAWAWQGRIAQLALQAKSNGKPLDLLQAQPLVLGVTQDAHTRVLRVQPGALSVMGAAVRLQKFDWQWDQAAADALGAVDVQLVLEPLDVPALLAAWQPDTGWGGDLKVLGHLHLQHSQSAPWVVDAELARLSGDITLAEPTVEGNVAQRLGIRQASVTLLARNGLWALNEYFDGRAIGVVQGQQTVQAHAPDALPSAADPLAGEVDVRIANLRPWGTWLPAGWRLTGTVQAQAKVSGTLGLPQYTGQVEGQNLGLSQALLGVNLTDGSLRMALQGDRFELTELTARSGVQGGTIVAKGQAALEDPLQAQLNVQADRFALLQRVDRRIVISGDAKALLGGEDLTIEGRVAIDEGLIDITRSDAPTVGDDVNVLHASGRQTEDESESAKASGAKHKLHATIDVDLGHNLRLKGRGVDATLAGAIAITTPNNKPSIRGIVNVEDGTYAAYGQKLLIERGAITFTGAMENPRLDILAMRPQSPMASASDVKVGVSITGTALDPRVRLYSDPAMSETEKLSWLVLGRAPTGLGGADIGLLQTAAVALLSGEKSSPSDNLVSRLGLDELSVRQSEGTVHETVVNLGKQVSKYWYLGYERSLSATAGNWQLIYSLAQRLKVRAQAGADNAVDFIWSWRWD